MQSLKLSQTTLNNPIKDTEKIMAVLILRTIVETNRKREGSDPGKMHIEHQSMRVIAYVIYFMSGKSKLFLSLEVIYFISKQQY